jgi:SAM-dependent methyltransferase
VDPSAVHGIPRDHLLARLYDWEHDEFRDDADLYVALARRSSGPVLEPTCGSGRALLPIAALGIDVVGLDSSEAMLARARQRLDGVSGRVQLERRDMHDELPPGPFGLVFFALSGFGFSTTTPQQLALLRAIAERLLPDGVLALDLVHARALIETPEGVPVLQRYGADDEIGAHVSKWIVQNVHASDETLELFSFYDLSWTDGYVTRVHDLSRFRYFSRFEIELLMHTAGLEVEGVYGTYELGPFEDQSQRMIVLARRARGGARGIRRGRQRGLQSQEKGNASSPGGVAHA